MDQDNIDINPSNEADSSQDIKLKEALAAIDKGTLTAEQKEYLRDIFVGRDESYKRLSPQEKADFLLQEWEKGLISNMPDLESTKKEFYGRTHSLEVDESKDKIHNTHINIKAGQTRLIIASEGGKVITINNKEALEEYRQALINSGKKTDDSKQAASKLHSSRNFS
jgi:hypothetical protein